MIKILEVTIRDQAEIIRVQCPACNHTNKYIVHPEHKFIAVHHCYECGVILEVSCEMVKENETNSIT